MGCGQLPSGGATGSGRGRRGRKGRRGRWRCWLGKKGEARVKAASVGELIGDRGGGGTGRRRKGRDDVKPTAKRREREKIIDREKK